MKASPRTSIVLATTLIAGGIAAGSVSHDVMKPSESGFLGTAGSFFSPIEPESKDSVQVAAPIKGSADKPVAVANSTPSTTSNESPATGELRLAVGPTDSPTPNLVVEPTPSAVPESSPIEEIEPTPEPSLSPGSIPSGTPESSGETSP